MLTKEDIRDHIYSLQDMKYREFHGSLIPGEDTLIGVRVPVLRQYAKELYKEYKGQVETLLDTIGDEYYEEVMLQGMIIGLQKKQDPEALMKQIDSFVPKIKNWAVCDVFCAGLKDLKKYPSQTYDYLQKYLDSDEEYSIRFGVVMLLDYYINEEYLEKVFMHAQRITHSGYYVKMAVAWMLSVCFVKFYDETRTFMEKAELDDFTYNKALQKARESYRITPERKDELEKMKRKGNRKCIK